MFPQEIKMDMASFQRDAEKELTERIIPFWKSLHDEENGGFIGYVDYELTKDPLFEKGGILNSRILYFFSESYLLLQDETLLKEAQHAYQFMRNALEDKKRGGIYWSVDYKGNPKDTTKHCYCQAFAIYGLCSYYRASKDAAALALAWELFEIIESKMKDEGGYLEAFNVDFTPASNEKLSENGVSAARTMNTILHVIEAYTQLYRIGKEEDTPFKEQILAKTGNALSEALTVVTDRIYNPAKKRQEVFFDREYRTLIDLYSYGHDIEAAWLLDLAADTLANKDISEKVHQMSSEMEAQVYIEAFDGESLPAECEAGVVKEDRVWWVQAEAVNGYLKAYLKNPNEIKYYTAARAIFTYIEEKVTDPRENSEWFWYLHADGTPAKGEPIAEPWKCPYHNGRMCFEIIRSLSNAS